MQVFVDLSDTQVRELDKLSKEEKRPREALIQEAINDYLAKQCKTREVKAFGLWGQHKVDGLACQEKIRGEW